MIHHVASDHRQSRRQSDQFVEGRGQRIPVQARRGRPPIRERAGLARSAKSTTAPPLVSAARRWARLSRSPGRTTTLVRMSRRAATAANAIHGSAGLLSVAMPNGIRWRRLRCGKSWCASPASRVTSSPAERYRYEIGLVVATRPSARMRRAVQASRHWWNEHPARVTDRMLNVDGLPGVQHLRQAARHQRVDADAQASGQRRLPGVALWGVGALHEAGPAGRLSLVEDPGNVGITTVVQADAGHAEPVIAQPSSAGPRRQVAQRGRRLGRSLPVGLTVRLAQAKPASRASLAVPPPAPPGRCHAPHRPP